MESRELRTEGMSQGTQNNRSYTVRNYVCDIYHSSSLLFCKAGIVSGSRARKQRFKNSEGMACPFSNTGAPHSKARALSTGLICFPACSARAWGPVPTGASGREQEVSLEGPLRATAGGAWSIKSGLPPTCGTWRGAGGKFYRHSSKTV